MDGHRIKELLNQRAEDVCQHLLPGGRRDRNEWIIGDVRGTPGTSLRVHLDGAKIGWWADFAQADQYRGRNLISLWMAVRDCDFKAAMDEIRDWLGVKNEWRRGPMESRRSEEKKTPPADLSGLFVGLERGGLVHRYLTEERKLSEEALKKYRIGQSRDGKHIVFPSFDAQERLVSVKFMAVERQEKGGKIIFVQPQGAPKLLFGIHAITPTQQDICITEGEIDAMSMFDFGIPAVSVPFGAKWPGADGRDPNSEWIEHDFDWLEMYPEVYLALDCDDPGRKATAAIARRLSRERCRVVEWPDHHKDANECLQAGLDDLAINQAMEQAAHLDPAELKRPEAFRKEMWNRFYPEGGVPPGDELPWAMPFRFRPGEMTVWQGYAKHGKTVCLGYCLLTICAQKNRRTCIGSFEIPAPMTLQNLVRQLLGKEKPETEGELNRAIDWLNEHVWIYDKLGMVEADALLEAYSYAARKYGITHFVADSLMRMNVDEEDNDAQKVLMNRLLEFAAQHDAHFHLIAHSRKPDQKHPEDKYWPGKYSVRGSAHIVDLAHNVVTVWRNKEKELEIYDLEMAGSTPEMDPDKWTEIRATNDAMFVVLGQRGGNGEEPLKQLWYDHKGSWQFADRPGEAPRRFLEKNVPAEEDA